MIRITRPGGLIIITCAGIGRATHGTVDSDEYSSPFTTDYYRNLGANDIADRIQLGSYFKSHGFEVNSKSNDLYFWGIRSESFINEDDEYWEDPMSRLARAQGQLAQAAARHAATQAELERITTEAELAKAKAHEIGRSLKTIQESRSWKALESLRTALVTAKKFTRIGN